MPRKVVKKGRAGGVEKVKAKPKAPELPASPKSPKAKPEKKVKPKTPKAQNKPAELLAGPKSEQPSSPKVGTAASKGDKGLKTVKAQKQPEIKPAEPVVLKKEVTQATQKKNKVADELQAVEKQIFDLETRYLENSHPLGNALRGYEGLLTQSQASTRRTLVRLEDRLFSNSSLTGNPR